MIQVHCPDVAIVMLTLTLSREGSLTAHSSTTKRFMTVAPMSSRPFTWQREWGSLQVPGTVGAYGSVYMQS